MTIERASPNDVMELACDTSGTSMQVAAVLILSTPTPIMLADARRELSERFLSVPRLRQRLLDVPFGCGRPIWVDDSSFDIDNHLTEVRCATGGEQVLLDVVADTICKRLPPERPLWSAVLVTGFADEHSALVVVFHHVLADGIGGLAILDNLADGGQVEPDVPFPRPVPDHREIFLDAVRNRMGLLRRLPAAVRQLRAGAAELGLRKTVDAQRIPPEDARRGHAQTSVSLNRPIGTGRAVAVVRANLMAVASAAHARGATVNDVVVSAVAGAVRRVLAARGEHVAQLVISMPVSDRRRTDATDLGNHVGVIPVRVPTTGEPGPRLEAVAAITRGRKTSARGASAPVVSTVFRLLATAGVFGWFIARQRLVNTFVSNMRGPDRRLSLLGRPVTEIIPVSMISGNITVAFTALSYCGILTVTVVADSMNCPDYQAMADALQRELDTLTDRCPESPITGSPWDWDARSADR